jgi:hypothetical protein
MRIGSRLALTVVGFWAPLIGCQQPLASVEGPSAFRAVPWTEGTAVVLAADSRSGESAATKEASIVASQPASGPATQPAAPLPYSAPAGVGQPLMVAAMIMMPAAMVNPSQTDTRQYSDSVVGQASMRSSAFQLTSEGASPARVFASVGKQGFQRGQPLPSGFMLGTSIFTPRANPSAPRCQELVRGGFFPNMTACRNSFRR